MEIPPEIWTIIFNYTINESDKVEDVYDQLASMVQVCKYFSSMKQLFIESITKKHKLFDLYQHLIRIYKSSYTDNDIITTNFIYLYHQLHLIFEYKSSTDLKPVINQFLETYDYIDLFIKFMDKYPKTWFSLIPNTYNKHETSIETLNIDLVNESLHTMNIFTDMLVDSLDSSFPFPNPKPPTNQGSLSNFIMIINNILVLKHYQTNEYDWRARYNGIKNLISNRVGKWIYSTFKYLNTDPILDDKICDFIQLYGELGHNASYINRAYKYVLTTYTNLRTTITKKTVTKFTNMSKQERDSWDLLLTDKMAIALYLSEITRCQHPTERGCYGNIITDERDKLYVFKDLAKRYGIHGSYLTRYLKPLKLWIHTHFDKLKEYTTHGQYKTIIRSEIEKN